MEARLLRLEHLSRQNGRLHKYVDIHDFTLKQQTLKTFGSHFDYFRYVCVHTCIDMRMYVDRYIHDFTLNQQTFKTFGAILITLNTYVCVCVYLHRIYTQEHRHTCVNNMTQSMFALCILRLCHI